MQHQIQCIDVPFLGLLRLHPPRLIPLPSTSLHFRWRKPGRSTSISCSGDGGRKRGDGEKGKGRGSRGGGDGVKVKVKEKENVWSVDNDMAAKAAAAEEKRMSSRVKRRRGRPLGSGGRRRRNSLILVSVAMLMEVETVLQTQEPVIKPVWNTFVSSVSGIWKGVGAVFSPSTAEMEPIGMGNKNEHLYDCYTLSCIKNSHSDGGHLPKIHRKTNWVALNPFGENRHNSLGNEKSKNGHLIPKKEVDVSQELPSYESFDFGNSDILEEEFVSMEPGLVFFEDGSYSRGPVNIPVGAFDESKYFLSPTFKFEQCLVKGCHKRLRIVHTIEFSEGGSNIQIIRVAVYEEQWVGPANLQDGNDDPQFDLRPFSQRKRTQPSELTGSWKVFEMSATPIFSEEVPERQGGLPYVYLCTESLKKRSLPENQVCFGEEEMLDMQDVTVLWLPGGVTGYVDANKDGILCIGVGWYSDEGVKLVMERDYGMDGKLKEVRWKSEVKRRWNEQVQV